MEYFSEYQKKDNILIKLDGRIKFFIAVFLIFMIISYEGLLFPLLILGLNLLITLYIRVPLRIVAIRFSEPLFIIFVLIFIKAISEGTSPFFELSLNFTSISFFSEGLLNGVLLSLRIISATSVVILLGFIMPFTELIGVFTWFKIPRVFVEILVFAYKYIFILFEEAQVVYNAQKNRLGYSTIKKSLKSFSILSGSLILKAFEHSQNTALSMAQRGFDGSLPMMNNKSFQNKQLVSTIIFIAITSIIWHF
ncbi:MAG: cobalt ECF transporter T component CbiQ [Thermodesulfovibrionales bacterium]|nr:cobalt ECF transporter T component CbiQ [Thermodesulfovibrionales bacterium]